MFDYNCVLSENQCKQLNFQEQEKVILERAQKNIKDLFHQMMSIKLSKDKEQNKKDENLQIIDFDKDPYDVSLPDKTSVLPR